MEREEQIELKRKQLLEKIQITKKVDAEEAAELLKSMELFCELIIKRHIQR